MSLLAQQALLEPEPVRFTVVPRAVCEMPGWWGVDSAAARVNIGWVCEGFTELRIADGLNWTDQTGFRRGVQSVKLGATQDNDGQRLSLMRDQLCALVEAMLDAGIPPPGVAHVERPVGKNPSPIMYQVCGLAAEAVYTVVRRRAGFVPFVEFTASAHWKKMATGHGTQNKPKFGRKTGLSFDDVREDYGVMKWARANGYPGMSWDDADASGIAEGARRDIGIRG